MGLVAIELKIMPASPDTDLDKILDSVRKLVRVQDSKMEPLAFGLKALKVVVTTEDRGGGTESLEAELKKIAGVGDVEVEAVTLV